MKFIFVSFAFLSYFISLSGHAQTPGQPYALDSGEYSLECWTTTRLRKENGGIDHSVSYQNGEDVVSKNGNVTTETFSLRNEDGTLLVKQTSKTTTTDLGDGLFIQTIENSFEGKTAIYELKVEVSGQITQFISSHKDGQSRDVSGREFSWQKMADGRVIAQNYFVTPLPTEVGSAHAAAMCIFTRTK